MSLETMEAVIAFLLAAKVNTLDITGGAPELHPEFCYLVRAAREQGIDVIDRCNLTILTEPGFVEMGAFLADQQVDIMASLPCYLEENVDRQRGSQVFAKSILALQGLNRLGYGCQDGDLTLNLVYNPQGAVLPPPQQALEARYREILYERYKIVFNQLLVLCNMPINRFGSMLISNNAFDGYMGLLKGAYQAENLARLMCRGMVSVDWQGYLYDCDFNQMLNLKIRDKTGNIHIKDLHRRMLLGRPIITGEHCYGCTAGQGSSCGGALA